MTADRTAEDAAGVFGKRILELKPESLHAVCLLAEALKQSRKLDRGTLFGVLEQGAHVLASVQQGKLPAQICDAFVKTDRRWTADKTESATISRRPTSSSA